MSNDIPTPVRIQIIRQDLQMWKNTRWQFEMRHRVNKRIGNDTKELEAEMVKAEGAIAELEAMLKEVEAEGDK